MKTIPLTQGKVTIVDDEDYEHLSRWKWYCANGYACRRSSRKDGPQRNIFLHRVVARATEGECVDHANRDRLDNTRANLRICTYAQNRANAKCNSNNTLGMKGVTQQKKKFRATIRVNGKLIIIGRYPTPEQANAAYAEAAAKHFGEFARN